MLGVVATHITPRNAEVVTGLRWREVVSLCRRHEIPVKRVSKRRLVVDAAAFAGAIRRAAAWESKRRDEIDRLLVELGITQ